MLMVFWGRPLIRNLPLFIGLRYFSSGARRSRLVSFISLLALLGLSLGVGLLILVLSVMNGFDREMREHILSIVPHVQITNSTAISNWQSQRELIATVPNVKEVTPFNELEGIIFSKNNTSVCTLKNDAFLQATAMNVLV